MTNLQPPQKGLYVGRRLSFPVADGHATYVVKSVGKRTVRLQFDKSDESNLDGYRYMTLGEGGSIKLELAEQMAAHDDVWAELGYEHEVFYDGLKPGDIVHYDNGFEDYVRCEVVLATPEIVKAMSRVGDAHAGDKVLKAVALVGDWKEWKLQPNEPWVKWVKEGHYFTPNAWNLYEYPVRGERKKLDPRNLQPLQLPQ